MVENSGNQHRQLINEQNVFFPVLLKLGPSGTLQEK